jgi:hypothetical protein
MPEFQTAMGFYRFNIGDFQATVISDGYGPIPVPICARTYLNLNSLWRSCSRRFKSRTTR